MKTTVKQMRGPGMNLGLKKPRKKPAEPKPYTPSREQKAALKGNPVSYLPPEGKGGKPRAPKAVKAPKGKAPFKL
jgi:hypothetical protein